MSTYTPGVVRRPVTVALLVVALVTWTFGTPLVEAALSAVFPRESSVIYGRSPLSSFLVEHLLLVGIAGLAAVTVGVAAGLLVLTPGGRPFRDLVMRIASFAQSIPSVAIMALAVPAIGYGWKPVLLALVVYSILPVMVNVVAGIEAVPPDVIEAGRGMGMTRAQRLMLLELPLAMPVIMTGVRTMLVIVVSAATLGAVVGAGGLGVPIMSGIGSFNNAIVTYGAVPAVLLALVVDQAL